MVYTFALQQFSQSAEIDEIEMLESEYQQLRKGHNPLQIEIVGKTPEFQALHWEALWEPDFP
jgi:hypothetical protein